MDQVEQDEEWAEYQREMTAYHEAGHVVAYYLLGVPFEFVTIVANERFLGCVRPLAGVQLWYDQAYERRLRRDTSTAEDIDRARRHAIILAAGPMASVRADGDDENLEIGSDRVQFDDMMKIIPTGNDPLATGDYLTVRDNLWKEAARLWECAGNWRAVCAVAEALLDAGTLTYEQVCPIIEATLRRSLRRGWSCPHCRSLRHKRQSEARTP